MRKYIIGWMTHTQRTRMYASTGAGSATATASTARTDCRRNEKKGNKKKRKNRSKNITSLLLLKKKKRVELGNFVVEYSTVSEQQRERKNSCQQHDDATRGDLYLSNELLKSR